MRALIDDLLWWFECRINRRLPGRPKGWPQTHFRPVTSSIDVLAGETPPGGRPKLVVGITTHGRPGPCTALLEELHASLAAAGLVDDVFLVVMRDTCDHDYASAKSSLENRFPGRHALYESNTWIGKKGRFLVFQRIFDAVRALSPDLTIMLEDDVSVPPAFIGQSIELFERIDDPRKACLYLARFDDDEPNGRWIRFRRRPTADLPIHQTQWFDLHAFIAGPLFFELLDWHTFQPHDHRWLAKPERSSGVSEQFTRRLMHRGHVYQVDQSLAFHGRVPSVLNVEARRERSLNNFPGSGT